MSGGGMRCCWNAGVLDSLSKDPNVPDFDIVIAASGSSGPATYYVSRQLEFLDQTFGAALSSRRLLNIWRFWRIFDVDYLVDKILKKRFPVDSKTLYSSKQRLYIPVIHSDTGRIKYFCNKNGDDMMQAIKATHSAPVFTKGSVEIDGHPYQDSLVTSYPYFHIQMARRLGAEKIVVIDCLSKPGFLTKMEQLITRRHPDDFKYQIHRRHAQLIKNYGQKSDWIIRVKPSGKIPADEFEINGEKLLAGLNMGRQDGKKINWKRFFDK